MDVIGYELSQKLKDYLYGVWERKSPIPWKPRDGSDGYFGAIYYEKNGSIYAFVAGTSNVYVYRPSTDTWETKYLFIPIMSQYGDLVLINDVIYLITSTSSPRIIKYDIASNKIISLNEYTSGTYSQCCIAKGTDLYIIGREIGEGYQKEQAINVYHTLTATWEFRTKLPKTIYQRRAVIKDDIIYIFQETNQVLMYNTSTNILENINVKLPLNGLYNYAIGFVRDDIHMIGGRFANDSTRYTNNHLVYSIKNNNVKTDVCLPCESAPRLYATVDNAIYCIDGDNTYVYKHSSKELNNLISWLSTR